MPTISFRLLYALLLLASSVWAHDPLMATIEARADDSSVSLRITMTSSVAAYLAGVSEGPRRAFAPESFASNQSHFERLASELCMIRSGQTAVPPASTVVRLTAENEVEVDLSYPKPPAGRLGFEAKWLTRLPVNEEYQAIVLTGKGCFVTELALLNAEKPALVVQLGEKASPPAK